MSKIKMIKGDAIVNIKIGAAFLGRLQKVMFGIVTEKSQEDIENFKKESEEFSKSQSANPEFSEDWMNHLFTMSVLISEVEQTIINEGLTFDKEIEDDIKEDNSLPDQFQVQPE